MMTLILRITGAFTCANKFVRSFISFFRKTLSASLYPAMFGQAAFFLNLEVMEAVRIGATERLAGNGWRLVGWWYLQTVPLVDHALDSANADTRGNVRGS